LTIDNKYNNQNIITKSFIINLLNFAKYCQTKTNHYKRTFVLMLKSLRTSKNLWERFSPVWGPDKIQKSNVVDFNFQFLSSQCTDIPRNGSWFKLVHASTVNDNRPGASYLLYLFNKKY
jgi:hypothetical protein